MDFNILIGSLQLATAAIQLKLDHFSKSANKRENDGEELYRVGEAIRILEFALAETVDFVGQTDEREPNARLAQLWADASVSVAQIPDSAELADIMFEKNLYWRNPNYFRDSSSSQLQRISIENVLNQIRTLRRRYEKLGRKIRG